MISTTKTRHRVRPAAAALLVALTMGHTEARAGIGDIELLALRGEATSVGTIQFFNDPSVTGPNEVLVRAAAGAENAAVLLGGGSRPLTEIATGADTVDGVPILLFDQPIAGTRSWSRFSTVLGPGVAAVDAGAGTFTPVAGLGADSSNAGIFPRQLVAAGDWLAIVEGIDARPDLVGLTAIAPFADPPKRTDALRVGDRIDGKVVAGFVSDSATLDANGTGLATVAFDGGGQAIIEFVADSGSTRALLATGDPAPGVSGTTIEGILSAPRTNATGAWAVKADLSGTGGGTVVYCFAADGSVLGAIREGAPVPDSIPEATFADLGSPIVGSTGAVFTYRRQVSAGATVAALGMIPTQGGFRTLALAGGAAPGGGAFVRFEAFMAMNPRGVLVFRAQTQTGTAYFGIDTARAAAPPYRIVGPGATIALPSGTGTIATVGTIATSGGQDGLGASLGDRHLLLTAGLQAGQIAVIRVGVVPDLDGDANCDGSVTSADMPRLLHSLFTGGRSPCGFDDADGDGRVGAGDIDALQAAIFDS